MNQDLFNYLLSEETKELKQYIESHLKQYNTFSELFYKMIYDGVVNKYYNTIKKFPKEKYKLKLMKTKDDKFYIFSQAQETNIRIDILREHITEAKAIFIIYASVMLIVDDEYEKEHRKSLAEFIHENCNVKKIEK